MIDFDVNVCRLICKCVNLWKKKSVEFEVLTVLVMKSYVLWDMLLCGPVKANQCFGGMYHLNLQG
jgi:hypothetical protein